MFGSAHWLCTIMVTLEGERWLLWCAGSSHRDWVNGEMQRVPVGTDMRDCAGVCVRGRCKPQLEMGEGSEKKGCDWKRSKFQKVRGPGEGAGCSWRTQAGHEKEAVGGDGVLVSWLTDAHSDPQTTVRKSRKQKIASEPKTRWIFLWTSSGAKMQRGWSQMLFGPAQKQ